MSESRLLLRCPHCNEWAFEPIPPDSWHSAFSFDEPLMSSFHGEVKKQAVVCQNRKCRKSFSVYWYAPMEYLNRM